MIKEDFAPMGLWIVDITKEHLALLSSADIHKTKGEYSDFIGFGGYRPFGNSDHYGDMAKALGVEMQPEDGFREQADKLYDDLDGVLMVVLKRRSFDIGRFYSIDMGSSWFTEDELSEAGICIRDMGDKWNVDTFAPNIKNNTKSLVVRMLVDRTESLRALLVKSHDQLLRLVTTFVSDRDGAHLQTCDLMREIREACPQDKFAGGSDA